MANEYYEKAICRLTCGEEGDCDKATAFLISPNRAVTARHAIEDHYSEGKNIYLEFPNIDNEPIIRTATPLDTIYDLCTSITVLELNEKVDCDIYLTFCDYPIGKDDLYETFGYPIVKWSMGQRIKSNVSRKVTEDMVRPYDWDIDLNHQSPIENFEGLSGSPLFINENLVGVVLTESSAHGKAISLGSISVESIKDVLTKLEIRVDSPIKDFDMNEIYEIGEESDFLNSTFIAKLESAEIYDHEDCQQEFFNAEIAKSSIESRGITTEIKDLGMLKEIVKSIWKTQHRPYKDEKDGNELLTKVYERVEDLNGTTLKISLDISLIAKKGILHQLSDECKVGWVKNYKKRLKEYLLKGSSEND
ncbi:trypsin-like serine peptidase [Priestia aryabhattai]